MHNSLTIRANILLILFWASALIIMLTMNWPQPLAPVAVACLLGVVAGALQTLAIKSASPRFTDAQSTREVRLALASTTAGKCAIGLLWITAAGMLAWAFQLNPKQPLILWIPCYAAFALARELVSLPAVARLSRAKNLP